MGKVSNSVETSNPLEPRVHYGVVAKASLIVVYQKAAAIYATVTL